MLTIRLRRTGGTNAPAYRIVVSDGRRTPTAKVVEELGHYDPTKNPPLLTFDRDKAKACSAVDALRGSDLCVSPAEVAPGPPGYVFHFEVERCRAVDREGKPLGVVKELADAAGRALLVVETPHGSRDVPFTEPIVVSVDLGA